MWHNEYKGGFLETVGYMKHHGGMWNTKEYVGHYKKFQTHLGDIWGIKDTKYGVNIVPQELYFLYYGNVWHHYVFFV